MRTYSPHLLSCMKPYLLKKLCAWLLPYHCILCSYKTERWQDLCDQCRQALPQSMHACWRCAMPMPETGLCGLCLTTPPPFDHTHALYLYASPITNLILELKFSQALINARILGELLAEQITHTWYAQKPLPDLIIPMPLHVTRLKERGFNQAIEMARPIAQKTRLPLDVHSVLRIKPTLPQATLSASDRIKNVQGAFAVTCDLSGLHIAVVDDVITTGNTMREFCHILKQHGAQTIDVWCIARPDKIW